MASATPDNWLQGIPSLTVRFNPNDLPSGQVDLQDLRQFISGLQMAAVGFAQYSYQLSATDYSSPELQPYRNLYIVTSEGSVLTIVYFLVEHALSFVQTHEHAIEGVGRVILAIEKDLGHGTATGVGSWAVQRFLNKKDRAEQQRLSEEVNSLKQDQRRLRDEIVELQRQLAQLTTSPANQDPHLVTRMANGATRMAQVAGQPNYSSSGITVDVGHDVSRTALDRPAHFGADTQQVVMSNIEAAYTALRANRPRTSKGVVTAVDLDSKVFTITARTKSGVIRREKYHYGSQLEPTIMAALNEARFVRVKYSSGQLQSDDGSRMRRVKWADDVSNSLL